MAKTKSSVRGVPEKKIVVVKPYKKSDGTKVKEHRRSTPNQKKLRFISAFLVHKRIEGKQRVKINFNAGAYFL